MDTYSLWVAYGFLIVIAVFFSFFIEYAVSGKKDEIQIKQIKPQVRKSVSAGSITISGGMLPFLNLIQYSILLLILLNIVIIFLFIL